MFRASGVRRPYLVAFDHVDERQTGENVAARLSKTLDMIQQWGMCCVFLRKRVSISLPQAQRWQWLLPTTGPICCLQRVSWQRSISCWPWDAVLTAVCGFFFLRETFRRPFPQQTCCCKTCANCGRPRLGSALCWRSTFVGHVQALSYFLLLIGRCLFPPCAIPLRERDEQESGNTSCGTV